MLERRQPREIERHGGCATDPTRSERESAELIYACLSYYKKGEEEAREAARQRHLTYLRDVVSPLEASPWADATGNEVAAFMIIEADDVDEAMRLHAEDPYTKEGVYDVVRIYHWWQDLNR